MADTREERLEYLKACPELAVKEVLYFQGALHSIAWDGLAPTERAINVADYFDGMPPRSWGEFRNAVDAVQAKLAALKPGHIHLPGLPPGPFKLSGLPQVNTKLFGRDREQRSLECAWEEERPYVVGLIGEGGQGKTVLIQTWLKKFRADFLRGATCVYVHSFYQQSSGAGGTSDDFLSASLHHLDVRDADSDKPAEKALRLARELRKFRVLLILDAVEPLQEIAEGPARFEDDGIKTLLRELAQGFNGLCLVSSRRPLRDLAGHIEDDDYMEIPIDPVQEKAGAEIVVEAGASSAHTAAEAARQVGFHGLSMKVVGRLIGEFLGGDASRLPEILPSSDEANTLEEALAALDERLSDTQRCMMRLIGLFEQPAELKIVRSIWEPPVIEGVTESIQGFSPEQWLGLAESLRDLGLLWPPDPESFETIDTHPRIRAFFGKRLREETETGWRECHRRIYERLCKTTEHRPDTLSGLQPLYQAVAHGCRAGLHAEARRDVYRDRILRGTGSGGNYSTFKLGAIGADLGAVACFFDEPWRRLSPNLSAADQAWLLNEAAFSLSALGRLTEAVEPMRAALEMRVAQDHWKNAAIGAGNLSELELTLGDVAAAVADAGQAVTFADRSGDEFQRTSKRTTHADALHQAGRRDDARALFERAESLQAERQPEYSQLYSVQGFKYGDLLLSAAERAAWQRRLNSKSGSSEFDAAMADCDDVAKRASQTLEWAERHEFLLDIALDHLTLARAGWYRASVAPSKFQDREAEIQSHLAAAVDGLRASGNMDDLPRGLLTRAWFRYHTGNPSGSRQDLDEAEDIASRGPMPLYLAEILLTRARLFGRAREGAHYPWDSLREDLAEARRLIEKHGYHRRDEELADAEEALRQM